MSNLIVDNFLTMMDTLRRHGRELLWVIEQPTTSFMMKRKVAVEFMQKNKGFRILTYMGCFQHDLLKPSHLFGNLPHLKTLGRSRPANFTKSAKIDTFYVNSGSGVSGGRNLPGAAEYTEEYCEAVYRAWRRSIVFKVPEASTDSLA